MSTQENARPAPTLGLTPEEIRVRYTALQDKLVPLWKSIASLNRDPQTIVVVPSITLDALNMPSSVLQAMEERFLFMLFLLRQPSARMIYVTSRTILPDVVDYYLGLLPGVIPAHARARFFNPVPHDSTLRPLSLKILERPRLLAQIRDLIPDKDRAHLVPYNTTELERDLAIRLGIPMYGADPRHFDLGTKSGCRKLFGKAGVSYPLGAEDLRTADDVIDAVRRLRAARPAVRSAMVKHNEGVSGAGNAVVKLDGSAPARRCGRARRHRGAGQRDAVREPDPAVRLVHGEARRAGRDRRGAGHRRGDPEPERPAAHHAARTARGALDARPGARRAKRAELPRLPVPRGPRLRGGHHARRGEGGTGAGRRGRPRALRLRLRGGPERRGLDALRDRAQPPEGRDDPPVPHAPVPDRRPLRPRGGDVHAAERPAEVLRGHRPSGVGAVPRSPAAGRLRHHGAARAPLQPDAADRGRAPHAHRSLGAGPPGSHRRRRVAGGGRRDLPAGSRRPGPGGRGGHAAGPLPAP